VWVFTTKGLKNGDLYMSLTLMEPFKRMVANWEPMTIIVTSKQHASILLMFPGIFETEHQAPELADVSPDELRAWCQSRGANKFAHGNLIYLHPTHFTYGPFNLMAAPTTPPLSYIDLSKMGLRIPSRAPLELPTITDMMCREAEVLARSVGLVTGRSVILFPYAQSSPQSANEHLATFATYARTAGFRVFTSVAGEERPVDGTTPVFIPFNVLLPFCELAGYVLALRSGISDIVSSGDLRKLFVYATKVEVYYYSVIDMGTAESASELVFSFDVSSPSEFLESAVPLLLAPLTPKLLRHDIPDFVRAYFDQLGDWTGDLEIGGAVPSELRRLRAMRGVVLGEGWAEIERWGVWSIRRRATIFLKNPRRSDPALRHSGPRGIQIIARSNVSVNLPRLVVQFRLGGSLREIIFTPHDQRQAFTVPIPPELRWEPYWRLDIRLDSPRSSFEQSGGAILDRRANGIGVESISIVSDVAFS
jgi:hypothetical protein